MWPLFIDKQTHRIFHAAMQSGDKTAAEPTVGSKLGDAWESVKVKTIIFGIIGIRDMPAWSIGACDCEAPDTAMLGDTSLPLIV